MGITESGWIDKINPKDSGNGLSSALGKKSSIIFRNSTGAFRKAQL